MAYLATLILIIAALTYHSLELGKIAAYEQRVTQISEQEMRDSVERFVEKNKDDRVKLIKFAKRVDANYLENSITIQNLSDMHTFNTLTNYN